MRSGFISVISIIVLSGLLFTETSFSQNKAADEDVFTIACIKTLFSDVDLNDATAAIKVWGQKLENQLKFGIKIDVIIFNDLDELINHPRRDYLGIIMLNSVDYLKAKSKMEIYPEMFPDINEDYLLLAKAGSYKNISDLKGRKLGIIKPDFDPFAYMWINTQVSKDKPKLLGKFFSEIQENKSESKLILSVFFGQLDACVVSRTAFETVSELNPQIKKMLGIVANSPVYLVGIDCFSKHSRNFSYKDKFIEVVLKLETYPEGKQIMTLLRGKNMSLFKPQYLNSVEELVKEYDKLKIKK